MERYLVVLILLILLGIPQHVLAAQQLVFETECEFDRNDKVYSESLYEVMDKADKLFKKNEYKKAYSLLGKAVAANPFVPRLRRAQACALVAMGKENLALKETNKSLTQFPGDISIITYRLAAFLNGKKWKEGIQYAEKMIEKNPDEPMFYMLYGMMLQNLHQEEKAREQYSYLLSYAPKDAIMYYMRGVSFEREGQYQKALADLNKAVQLASNTKEYYMVRASIYHGMEEAEKAQADIDMSVALGADKKEVLKIVYRKGK
ncbi:tetratricopeptide repeat protein [bacterium]|nr:tetratricopeptide repeat protein [bacterium]